MEPAGSGLKSAESHLRIVVVNRHLRDAVGGSELQCDLVARGLTARGHEVTYLAVGGSGGSASEGGEPSTTRSAYRIVDVTASAGGIVAAVRDLQPDVVYWRYGRRHLDPVVRATRRIGVPVVLAVAHADDVARWPPRAWPDQLRRWPGDARQRLRHRASYRALGRVAGVASQREDQLPAVRDRPVRLVRNLVVLPDPAPGPRTHPRPYVAWVGNLKARKRPELCRDLAEALAPLGVDVLMAGAVQDPAYGELIRPDPARPNLRYLGHLAAPEVSALIAGAICVPITYRPEGFSNVLLQAWAHGRATPSLGYDPDGLIASERLGGVADEDRSRFIALVRDLVRDQEVAAAAGARAAAVVRDRFDPERALDALEDLFGAVTA